MDQMTGLKILFSFSLTLIFSCRGVTGQDCNFPGDWSGTKWMKSRVDPNNKTLELMTYEQTFSYLSYSHTANTEHTRYTCVEFESTDNKHTYIRSATIDGLEVKRCIGDSLVNGVILHRESAETTSLIECKNSLENVDIYTVFTPVTVAPNRYNITASANCPFINNPYLINYRINQLEECVDDHSSVLNVQRNVIYLLACNYHLYKRLPLTGSLNCLSQFSATELGEDDDDNGGVLIFEWKTKTQATAFVYCARYYTFPDNKTISLSVDVTSTTDVKCQQNANYSWYLPHENRDYVQYKFEYKQFLVSTTSPSISSTTPFIPTSSPVPQAPKNIQVTLDARYTDIPNDRAGFNDDTRNQFASAAEIGVSQFGDAIFSQSADGSLVITMVVQNPTDEILTRLSNVISSGHFTLGDVDEFQVKGDSFYHWRDTDNCTSAPCDNGGVCGYFDGEKRCQCAVMNSGPQCSSDIDPNDPVNIQMALSAAPTDREAFNAEIRNKLAQLAGIQPSRIEVEAYSQSNSNQTVVTVSLIDASATILEVLETVVNEGGVTFAGTNINAVPNSFYKWQDDHKCPGASCENGGKCWVLQGAYSCLCLSTHTGNHCSTKLEAGQPVNIQVRADLDYSDIPTDTATFGSTIRTKLAAAAKINADLIEEPTYSPYDGKLVVTVTLTDPTAQALTNLRDAVSKGQVKFNKPDGTLVPVVSDSMYIWRDDDTCPEATCENDGTCWVMQGNYSCACPSPFTGPLCTNQLEPSKSSGGMSGTTRIIIIVVCCVAGVAVIVIVIVLLLRRQKKISENSDSEAGYGSNATLDEADREMYSTINKKPKAYHEKSFASDDDKQNGELTGIHL